MFDLLILGGTVVDGTGEKRYKADIGIKDGCITEIGQLNGWQAVETIQADGLIVSPGFIDCHTHSDLSILREPLAFPKISQGVTTEIIGNCGMSAAPLCEETFPLIREYMKPVLGSLDQAWPWKSVCDYIHVVEETGPAVNIAILLGHGTLRTAVMGFDNRVPTDAELREMKQLIQEGMEAGALGISTGLVYTPGTYAQTEELVELSKEVTKYGGVYATHLRDQVDGLVESVQEALHIGEKANIPIVISHHKTVGKRNFGKVNTTLKLLDQAADRGLQASSDTYPYVMGSTTLAAILPPWVLEGGLAKMFERIEKVEYMDQIKRDFDAGLPGWENRSKAIGWENIIISSVGMETNRHFEGKSILELAEALHKNPVDFVIELLLEEQGNVAILFNNSIEEDLIKVMTHPRTMIGSDGLDVGDNPHPRLYGTFPKVLGEYVRDKGVMSLEEGIHKMTGLTARQFNMENIGFITKGYRADITIFDSHEIKDMADFVQGRKCSQGISYVIVGGKTTYTKQGPTGVRAGKVIKRKKAQQ